MNLPNVRAICLQDSKSREERLASHLSEVGIEWKRFEGIDAKRWGLAPTHTYEVDNPHSGYLADRKHVGMQLSHYTLWTILKETGAEEMTILEDDVLFDADWKWRYTLARHSLPEDWDILMIGSGHTQYRPCVQVNGNVWDVKWPITTHAYIVHQRACDTLLRTQRYAGAPIDISLTFRSFPFLNVYTVLPRLAVQYDTIIDP